MELQNLQHSEPLAVSGSHSAASQRSAGGDSSVKELPTAARIQDWIAAYLAELLEVEPHEVDVSVPFDRYGLDSSAAVGLTGDLEDWLGQKLDPTLLYDYPTVEALAQHLAEESQ